MQLLGREIARAIRAIAENDIGALEDSIASQQDLASRLSELASGLAAHRRSSGPALPAEIDQEMAEKIRAATGEVESLNLRYSLLLQHSSRSLAQMSSLFRSFRDHAEEVSGARPKVQTWSCRI
jgi:hypothetical protein